MRNSVEQHRKAIACFKPGGTNKSLRQRRKEFKRSFYHGDINKEGQEAFSNISTSISMIVMVCMLVNSVNVFPTANSTEETPTDLEREKLNFSS